MKEYVVRVTRTYHEDYADISVRAKTPLRAKLLAKAVARSQMADHFDPPHPMFHVDEHGADEADYIAG